MPSIPGWLAVIAQTERGAAAEKGDEVGAGIEVEIENIEVEPEVGTESAEVEAGVEVGGGKEEVEVKRRRKAVLLYN